MLIVIAAIARLLFAIVNRVTSGRGGSQDEKNGKGHQMNGVLSAALSVVSNIGCSALSTVLLTGLTAQT